MLSFEDYSYKDKIPYNMILIKAKIGKEQIKIKLILKLPLINTFCNKHHG